MKYLNPKIHKIRYLSSKTSNGILDELYTRNRNNYLEEENPKTNNDIFRNYKYLKHKLIYVAERNKPYNTKMIYLVALSLNTLNDIFI